MLSDDEAQALAEAIHARRNQVRSRDTGTGTRATTGNTHTRSYFPPKRHQRSPDRQRSLERRRQLAASGPLPPQLAARFTTGELAVLRIVGDEVRDHGDCRLTVPEIAARSGTSQTTVRRALKVASSLGLITIEERRVPYRPNLSNVVRIVSREWLAWTTKAKQRGRIVNLPATHRPLGGRGFQRWKATDNQKINKEKTAFLTPHKISKEGSPDAKMGVQDSSFDDHNNS